MKTVMFTLSMPNRGSWNGRWSGENNVYAIFKRFTDKRADALLRTGSWYYRWEDGWGASISATIISGSDLRKARRQSKGFCGYDWMVESILKHGEIYADHQVPKANEGEVAA